MKKINLIVLLVTLALLTLGIVALINFYYYTLEVRTIGVDLRIGDRIGINLDTDKLWFGMIKPGASATRSISVSNNYDFPISMEFLVKGKLEKNIVLSSNNIVLDSKELKNIAVTAYAPKNMSYGNYTSIIKVISRRI